MWMHLQYFTIYSTKRYSNGAKTRENKWSCKRHGYFSIEFKKGIFNCKWHILLSTGWLLDLVDQEANTQHLKPFNFSDDKFFFVARAKNDLTEVVIMNIENDSNVFVCLRNYGFVMILLFPFIHWLKVVKSDREIRNH